MAVDARIKKSEPSPRMWRLREQSAGFFVALSSIYLLVLFLLLFGYYFGWLGLHRLPGRIGGIIPLAIPWFGAIGAVTGRINRPVAVAECPRAPCRYCGWKNIRLQ